MNYVGDAFNDDYAYNGTLYYPAATYAGTTTYYSQMTCPPWNPSSACSKKTIISTPYLYDRWALWFYDSAPAY
jgi:hypothetical protein